MVPFLSFKPHPSVQCLLNFHVPSNSLIHPKAECFWLGSPSNVAKMAYLMNTVPSLTQSFSPNYYSNTVHNLIGVMFDSELSIKSQTCASKITMFAIST